MKASLPALLAILLTATTAAQAQGLTREQVRQELEEAAATVTSSSPASWDSPNAS